MGTEETEETNLPNWPLRRDGRYMGAGYTRLEDLTKVTESDVMRLHGMGRTPCRSSATP